MQQIKALIIDEFNKLWWSSIVLTSITSFINFSRNYTGENLDPLSLRELQSLEQQIDTALKRVRTRKVKLALTWLIQLWSIYCQANKIFNPFIVVIP